MKKPELYLLFTALLIGTVILVMTAYHFIKPTTADVEYLSSSLEIKNNKKFKNTGWINKINQVKSIHSYPVEIYKIDF